MQLKTIRNFGWVLGMILATAVPAALGQGRPLIIGQSAALTGSQAEFGRDIRDGALAAFERINLAGGIHGRPIELLTLDDGGNEAKAKENSTILIDELKVLSLFGYISRPSSVAGAKIASEAKVPFIGPFSGTPALYKFERYVFTIRASYDDELAGMVNQLVLTGYRRIGFAYLNDAPITNQQIAAHDRIITIHRHNRAVLNENRFTHE